MTMGISSSRRAIVMKRAAQQLTYDSIPILLVDDHGPSRAVTRDVLQRGGFTVLEPEPGVESIETARTEHPELVVLSIAQGETDRILEIRRFKDDPDTRDIPLLVLTSERDPRARDAALTLGCDGYLPSPFSPRVLLWFIGHWMERARKSPAA
jgi:CheY-like chemotaxis protein